MIDVSADGMFDLVRWRTCQVCAKTDANDPLLDIGRPSKYTSSHRSRRLPTLEFRQLHCCILMAGAVMRRRAFIGLVGGAAAWPMAARAQKRRPARRIGAFILAGRNQQGYARALREGLEALGWVDGKNIEVEYRWATGDADSLRSDAASLVALDAEVIVSGGTQATIALREATGRIPIVFVHVADPVRSGLVQSLARPEGNMTGFAAYEFSIAGKWLELLKQIAPRVKDTCACAGARWRGPRDGG